MCTTIARGQYFGRNMDLDCSFGERIVITPRDYVFDYRKVAPMPRHYAMIGMAAVSENYPLYADAMNEKGLCMAGLNFPGNAYYPDQMNAEKYNVSPFELIPWVLGQCASIAEAKALMDETHLISVPFSGNLSLTPLHWHIADKSGSVVLESTASGLGIYDNPVGVLTNNPPFDFHLANLSHYANLSNQTPQDEVFLRMGSKMPGMGLGAHGLPGDYSSASRFIKAAWLNCFAEIENETEAIAQMLHMLSAVSPIKGAVLTADGESHYTTYTACMDAHNGAYYYKTYFDTQLRAVKLSEYPFEGAELHQVSLCEEEKQKITRDTLAFSAEM